MFVVIVENTKKNIRAKILSSFIIYWRGRVLRQRGRGFEPPADWGEYFFRLFFRVSSCLTLKSSDKQARIPRPLFCRNTGETIFCAPFIWINHQNTDKKTVGNSNLTLLHVL